MKLRIGWAAAALLAVAAVLHDRGPSLRTRPHPPSKSALSPSPSEPNEAPPVARKAEEPRTPIREEPSLEERYAAEHSPEARMEIVRAMAGSPEFLRKVHATDPNPDVRRFAGEMAAFTPNSSWSSAPQR